MTNRKFIILGASGDLAKKRLYPALFDLHTKDIKFNQYLGYGRKKFNEAEYKDLLKDSLAQKGWVGQEEFISRFKYVSGGYDKAGLDSLKKEISQKDEIIFYLSIPTSFSLVREILEGLKETKLIGEKTQIALEKPFGSDYVSADKLNQLLLSYFNEQQIFRIDHYLAKDLVRDLLTLRFSNSVFEPLWNSKFIESIQIQIKETKGIENRGEFYDQTGAIRDILQNHALQLLALTCMEQPKEISAKSIHLEKQKIFNKLRLFRNDKKDAIKIGQYKGYRNEAHVEKSSLTETYAQITAEINTKRWRNVPITMMTGKKMDKQTTDIIIKFKCPKNHPWDKNSNCLTNNELCINIQPHNHIELKLNFGFDTQNQCAIPINLKFGFLDNRFIFKDAYENALNDLQKGEQSIFLSSEEILSSWKFIDKVLGLIAKNRRKILNYY